MLSYARRIQVEPGVNQHPDWRFPLPEMIEYPPMRGRPDLGSTDHSRQSFLGLGMSVEPASVLRWEQVWEPPPEKWASG